MKKFELERVFVIDSGHRLMHHDGKCHNLHGHTYKIEVKLDGEQLGAGEMLIDFAIIKNVFKTWLDEHLDHGMILNSADTEVIELCQKNGWKHFTMHGEPTAENLSDLLFLTFMRLLDDTVQQDLCRVASVRVWETPNCCASRNRLSQ